MRLVQELCVTVVTFQQIILVLILKETDFKQGRSKAASKAAIVTQKFHTLFEF